MSDTSCWKCGSTNIEKVSDNGRLNRECVRCGSDIDNMYDFDEAKEEIFRLRAEVERLNAEINSLRGLEDFAPGKPASFWPKKSVKEDPSYDEEEAKL